MMGKTFHLISWQKNLLPPEGDFSSPNTWRYHVIFRVGGSRVHQFCGYMKVGHSQYTAPHQKAISLLPRAMLKASCSFQHKISKLHLMTGLKSRVLSWKLKKTFIPHISCTVCAGIAHHECCKKKILLSFCHVKKFWWPGLVIGVYPKIHPAYFLDGLW